MSATSKRNKTYIAAAVLIIIIIVGVAYYFTTQAPPSVTTTAPAYKDTLILGTTDSVESTIDPSNAYDYFGWAIIFATGSPLVEIRPNSGLDPAISCHHLLLIGA